MGRCPNPRKLLKKLDQNFDFLIFNFKFKFFHIIQKGRTVSCAPLLISG
ncbi:protein of unknown function [Ruminococcaceae bacterium BL-6]|nr:protein of unknown function [Ruminococcaceae bacterium BL-6]